ncbi:spindle and kinetochore-associated protein 2-like [Corticium candelabrum]|uniref:spindle and kinetochore-associated protein 2-like n=1 Tax=Corticium candelabrum TaxID=121492 RepID=UPI002E264A43|nr:spindle and kinetochore-associated protein 2-like [Corticium candelabrum]
MENTVEKLEALFAKAERDLDFMSRTLRSEFAAQFEESGEEELNPVHLVSRLSRARTRLETLRSERVRCEEERAKVEDELRVLTTANGNLLRSLQVKAGLK